MRKPFTTVDDKTVKLAMKIIRERKNPPTVGDLVENVRADLNAWCRGTPFEESLRSRPPSELLTPAWTDEDEGWARWIYEQPRAIEIMANILAE